MRIAIVSTFPPRHCGLATFAADLHRSLADAPGVDHVEVIAVTNGREHTDAPEVVATIAQEVRAEYCVAGRLVGRLGIDVVMIEHEYGIYGGRDGEYLLSFTSELTVPYAVTLHTVLDEPSPNQDRVGRELCRRAAAVLVFTETARAHLIASGHAPPERIHVVPHGAPAEITAVAAADGPPRPMPIEGDAGVGPATTADRFVVSCFGLLSPGKGLETAIDAVTKVAMEHPEVLLVIAGQTHPEIVRRHGEHYRLDLHQRVRELGISGHVMFDDRFLSVAELAQLLAATHVFVTPYRGVEQAVSGSLTFALAAGLPVVSTPFRYAEDLLAGGAGCLVPFGDAGALAAALTELIEDPARLAAARRAARAVGASLAWPAVGARTAEVLRTAAGAAREPEALLVQEHRLPPLRLDHLRTLVDDVGIVQHAIGSVPNRSTGYCVDDVARLVPVARQLAQRTGDPEWVAVMVRSVAFLVHAADVPTRCGMHNFMSYERRWLDHPHHGDHVGRSIRAMGDLLSSEVPPALQGAAAAVLERLADDLRSVPPPPRTAAHALLGLARLPGGADRWGDLVRQFGQRLVDLHQRYSAPGWDWFEPRLTYDNARLSQALIVAGDVLDEPQITEVGLRTLAWYGNECGLADPPVRLTGNRGRQRDEPHPGVGDEQPIDAAALVEAEIDALAATGDAGHGDRAFAAFGWFTGRNHLSEPLYDPTTGGCRDGLAADRVNINEGAESTLVYFAARLALEGAGLPVVARQRAIPRMATPDGPTSRG